jgi:hypothetical protein
MAMPYRPRQLRPARPLHRVLPPRDLLLLAVAAMLIAILLAAAV